MRNKEDIISMDSKSDIIAMIIVAFAIVLGYFGYKLYFECYHPEESMDYYEEMHNGHLYTVRNDHYHSGQPPMIHSPDCPCQNKK